MVLSKPAMEQLSRIQTQEGEGTFPVIDFSKPDSKNLIVKACEEFGFFKLTNHGVPLEFMSNLESEAVKFFSLPSSEKGNAGPPNPFGYGKKKIGLKGDVGRIEYLLLPTNPNFNSDKVPSVFRDNLEKFRRALNDYMSAVRDLGCEILELMAEGLKIQQRNAFSKLLKDEQSDSVFRINHYPPCPEFDQTSDAGNMIGFGEHTDPQIISILRSNKTSGLQIQIGEGRWISIPPDEHSFFINVGDSLKVMTNGRFHSVKHRVITSGAESRISMIYFAGPPLSEKIAPLPSLMIGNESLYKEFTWFEYKSSAYSTRLSENRLQHFEKIAAV